MKKNKGCKKCRFFQVIDCGDCDVFHECHHPENKRFVKRLNHLTGKIGIATHFMAAPKVKNKECDCKDFQKKSFSNFWGIRKGW